MMLIVYRRCPREVRQEAASCLAILGLRLNEDSQK